MGKRKRGVSIMWDCIQCIAMLNGLWRSLEGERVVYKNAD